MKSKIIQVYQTDPFEDGQGGGVRYVKNLLVGTQTYCDEILFLGTGKKEKKKKNIHLIPITKNLTGYLKYLFFLTIKLLFINLSKYDSVHIHRLYFAIPFILLKPKLKIICSLHGRTFTVFESKHGTWKLKLIKPIFMMIEKFSIKHIDFLVPVSLDVLHQFENKYPRLISSKKSQLKILGSMMDLSNFFIRDSNLLQNKFGQKNKYILFLGRLADVKDVPFLIEMFGEKFYNKSNIKLIIAGNGEKEDELKQLSKITCSINKPIFIGEVSPDTIPELISSANLVVLCSQHEASPTVVKEALSCGIPVVANKIGDVEEFIQNNRNGFIVEKTFNAYANVINKLLYSPLTKSDVRMNSENVLNKCTIEYISQEYIKIYQRVITK